MNKSRYEYLKTKWIINWCWWEKGFSFSKLFRNNIALFEEYLPVKWNKLISDIELELCWPHDVRCYNWNTYIWFLIANFIFAKDLYLKLHWTSLWNRITIFLMSFIWLMKYGKPYFNFWEKRNISLK